MYQRIGVAQVVEEFVAEALALVGAGDEARDIEELNRDGATAVDTGAVVGLASVRNIVAGAGAVYLEVSDGSLGIDRRESGGSGE